MGIWPTGKVIRMKYRLPEERETGKGQNLAIAGNIYPCIDTECEEEGTRNVVAECLGKLCLIRPEDRLPKLQARITQFGFKVSRDICFPKYYCGGGGNDCWEKDLDIGEKMKKVKEKTRQVRNESP